jgi:kinesin family protein 2/24
MEDLKDEMLAQVGTPKKANAMECFAAGPSDRQHGARRERLGSRDDSEISHHPKALSVAASDAAEEEDLTTRRMFDKRLLRRRHKDEFIQTLSLWRSQHLQDSPPQASDASSSRVRVCVRKRPLFENEMQADEFDVISVRDREVVVHNCLTKADLRSLFVSHMSFPFSRAFGEDTTDDQVYMECAAPAVEHTLNAGVATIFMFGQTGSGKTYTMGGLLHRTIAHLFRNISSRGLDVAPTVSLTAFQIAGRTISDLLDFSGAPKEVKVMEDKSHRTRVLGICSKQVQTASELLNLLQQAQTQRTTRATQVNDTSSRSHAVYRIWLGSSGAVLTLVDCAGSERREDSTHHDSQSRKDAAEINSTIFALKECFRVMRSSKGQQPPYRDSLLTRVLSDSFASEQALIMAIGTVSPSASDTEHSIGTLRALQQLQGTQMSHESREDVLQPKVHVDLPHPRTWSEDDVREWMEVAINGRAREHAAGITKGTDGKNLVRWPQNRFTQLCGGDDDLGARLYQDLRQKIRSAGA